MTNTFAMPDFVRILRTNAESRHPIMFKNPEVEAAMTTGLFISTEGDRMPSDDEVHIRQSICQAIAGERYEDGLKFDQNSCFNLDGVDIREFPAVQALTVTVICRHRGSLDSRLKEGEHAISKIGDWLDLAALDWWGLVEAHMRQRGTPVFLNMEASQAHIRRFWTRCSGTESARKRDWRRRQREGTADGEEGQPEGSPSVARPVVEDASSPGISPPSRQLLPPARRPE